MMINRLVVCDRTLALGSNRCLNRNCKRFVGQQPTPKFYNSLDRTERMSSRPQRRAPRLALNCATNYIGTEHRLKGPADPFIVLTRRKERS